MQSYIENFNSFEKKIVYDFQLGSGGIGDSLKFFMYILDACIKNNERLYYKKNNLIIEKYIKLKYPIMYIDQSMIDHNRSMIDSWTFVHPGLYYNTFNTNYSIDIKDVFYFTDKVKINAASLFPQTVRDYVSIHLRLGDKYLETDQSFVLCTHDERQFSEESLHNLISENYSENIFFCCDNAAFKLKLQHRYNKIITTTCRIGHSSLNNTTKHQVLDAISEFYILTNSKMIYGASQSGFSLIASKFNNIPYITL